VSTCGDGAGNGADGIDGGYGIDGGDCGGGGLTLKKAESREIIRVHHNIATVVQWWSVIR
jgi:hypothetical protein